MFNCLILTIDKNLFNSNIYSADLPTKSGIVEIMENHAEAFFVLVKGDILIKNNSSNMKTKEFKIVNGGIAYFKNNKLKVLIN